MILYDWYSPYNIIDPFHYCRGVIKKTTFMWFSKATNSIWNTHVIVF